MYEINTYHSMVNATKLTYVISGNFRVFVFYHLWNATIYSKTPILHFCEDHLKME
jgi:hypothetical protein